MKAKTNRPEAKRGQWWLRQDSGEVKVLAVFDGYVALRRKGAAPYLVRESHLYENYLFARDK